MMPLLSRAQMLGLDDSHVKRLEPGACLGEVSLHPLAAEAFLALRDAAMLEGFDLRAVSGFRSFQRQALIWNGKASGERAVLDADENPLDVGSLTDKERLEAILRWSALPGCSRHHWGSDLDVVDFSAIDAGGTVRLEARDWREGGRFGRLHLWLDQRTAMQDAMGFFRPYDGISCAVAAEPWHLSFAPLGDACERAFEASDLMDALVAARIELLGVVQDALDDILSRYVKRGAGPNAPGSGESNA